MDPLSITSGVIAIIQIATKIISVCKRYISDVKNAPDDLRNIMIELGNVKCVLEVFEFLLSQRSEGDCSAIMKKRGCMDNPLEGCKRAVMALEELFRLQVARTCC